MDPSWAVDDLPELERVLGATASDAGELSLDPVALARQAARAPPRRTPRPIPRVRRIHARRRGSRDERTADTASQHRATRIRRRPVDAETKDHEARRVPERTTSDSRTRAPNPKPPERSIAVADDEVLALQEDETPSEPRRRSRQVRMRTSKGTRKTTSWMSCWGRRGWADSRRGRRRGRRGADDDAFLDELLGGCAGERGEPASATGSRACRATEM